jgi:hypothetical protein
MEHDMRPSETLPASSPVIGWHLRLALVTLMIMPVTSALQTVRAAPDTPAAPVVAQAPAQAWPAEAYRVEWYEAHVPQEAATNRVLAVPVTLRNSGNRAWPASVVLLAYHWFRDDQLVIWDGDRTPLPRDLRAGGRVTLVVRVKTPTEPGSYVLQITLVHENVVWFEHKGANIVTRSIVVRPTTTSADCGDTGSTPCRSAR